MNKIKEALEHILTLTEKDPRDSVINHHAQEALAELEKDGWQPCEEFEKHGTEVIAWVSSDKGFQDITAKLYYADNTVYSGVETGWYWYESEEPVKRPDLIKGVQPWPQPPKAAQGE